MIAAEIRVAGRVFVAETCSLEAGIVTATGRWRRRMGANHAELRYSPIETCSWPIRRVDRIRWLTTA